jgi:hypothetical protein
MIKKLGTLVGIIIALIVIFLPLSYAVDEVNKNSQLNYAEYEVEVDYE